MKKRIFSPRKIAFLLVGTSLAALLSGCASAGLTESTFDLIKSAEEIKEELGKIHASDTGGQVVGSVSDPEYVETSISISDFGVRWTEGEFTATWSVTGASDDLSVQVYADSDSDGFDGEKVGSFTEQPANGEQSFTYDLMSGKYFFYLSVEDKRDRNTASAYSETPITIGTGNQDEGYLKNVSIAYEDGYVNFSWDDGGYERYRAVLINPETGGVLDESTVVGLQAKIQLPEGFDAVLAGVSYYENGEMGPYQEVEISKE